MLGGFRSDEDAHDEAVYRLAMSGVGTTAGHAGLLLGCTVVEARAALGRLAERGLVVRNADDEGRWLAAPPELVLAPELARGRERLRRDEELLADLVETFHRERSPRSAQELVEVVEGATQAVRLAQIEAAARHVVCAFQTGANTVVPVAETLHPEWQAPGPTQPEETLDTSSADEGRQSPLREGLAYRLVVDPAYLGEPGALQKLDEWTLFGQQVRVVNHQLPKVMVADSDIGLVQVGPTTTLVLHGPLAGVAQSLFDATWRYARPYLPRDAELETNDVQLLQLMLAGLTDAAMANQLGASPRTVQRRLRALMDLAGARTRIQLGGYAVRNGWV